MRSSFEVPDHEREAHAGPPADRGLRLRTGGITWPSWAGLEARPAVGGKPSEVKLVGRGPGQSGMRALTVVPVSEERQLPPEGAPPDWRQPARHAFVLERADAAFDERDAAVLADRAEALPDPGATVASVTKKRSAV